MVLPILLYGSEIWGYGDLGILEKVEFSRYILKLNKTTQKNILLYETSLLPLRILVKSRMVKYWVKVMTRKITTYVRKVTECLHNYYLNTEHKSNWIHFVNMSLRKWYIQCFYEALLYESLLI